MKASNDPNLLKKIAFEHTSIKVGFCEQDGAKVAELFSQGYQHVLLIDCNNVPTMNTIKGTKQSHEVKSGGAAIVEGEYILGVSKIPCSFGKCREPTL